jgi:restriction endonuclease
LTIQKKFTKKLVSEINTKVKLPMKHKTAYHTGGTTSLILYTVHGQEPDVQLYLVVETKSNTPRLSDSIAVAAQKKAFEYIGSNIKWELVTDVMDFHRELEKLIDSSL